MSEQTKRKNVLKLDYSNPVLSAARVIAMKLYCCEAVT